VTYRAGIRESRAYFSREAALISPALAKAALISPGPQGARNRPEVEAALISPGPKVREIRPEVEAALISPG
jgi:hypothetical protein